MISLHRNLLEELSVSLITNIASFDPNFENLVMFGVGKVNYLSL